MESDPQFIRERNYFRLVTTIVELGTQVIRRQILENLPRGETLQSILEKKRPIFDNLHNSKILTTKQLEILYPPDANVDIMNIDITLWFILLSKLVPSSRLDRSDWYRDILCIKEARNALSHLTKPEVEQNAFETQWNVLTRAIRRLEPERTSFDSYIHQDFDRDRLQRFEQIIQRQVLQEVNSELQKHLDGRRHYFKLTIIFFVIVAALLAIVAVALAIVFRDNRTCDQFRVSKEVYPYGDITFLPRDGWGAVKPWGSMDKLKKPALYVIYTHTAETAQCRKTPECCQEVKGIQYMHMHTSRQWPDIAYHFLIDSAGIVYMGRSLEYMPSYSTAKEWCNHTVSIALIGNFQYDTESDVTGEMRGAFVLLLQYLEDSLVLDKNYTLYALCEIQDTLSPGVNLYRVVEEMAKDYKQIRDHLRHRPNRCFFNNSLLDNGC